MLGTLTIPRGMSMVKALVPTLLGFVCYLSHINRTVEICVHYIQDNKNRKCEVHPKTLTVTVFPFLEFKNNPLVSLFSPRQSLVVIQYLERSWNQKGFKFMIQCWILHYRHFTSPRLALLNVRPGLVLISVLFSRSLNIRLCIMMG